MEFKTHKTIHSPDKYKAKTIRVNYIRGQLEM